MKAGHAGLKITTAAFNTIVKHLGDTLKEMGVPAAVIAEAAAVAETTRADIVEIKWNHIHIFKWYQNFHNMHYLHIFFKNRNQSIEHHEF